MDYNKFRIWVGRILGLVFLVFVKNDFNYFALGLLALGLLIRMWAAGYIHKNQEVTKAGPYKMLRHPLYLGNFLAGLGFALFVNFWPLVVLFVAVFSVVYYKKMRLEEAFLTEKFGDEYRTYMQNTPRIIPNLQKLFEKDSAVFSWQNVLGNREYRNLMGSAMIIVFFLMYQTIQHI